MGVHIVMRPFFVYKAKKSLFIMRQGRESEANAAGFAYRAQKPLHTGVRTGLHYLISLPVCLPVCMCNFMVLTDYESCTRPMSIYLASMEASEYELTRGTCCVARRLEVVAVAGLLWISWCVWLRRDFVFSMILHLQSSYTRSLAARDPEQSASTR